MSYVKGDRVRMVNNPAQVGTVTGERDQMFLSFVGIQWQSGDFGFVAPSNIELDAPEHNGSAIETNPPTDWQAAVGRVRDLHKPVTEKGWRPGTTETTCSECVTVWGNGEHESSSWPCTTITALDADQ